MQTLNIKEMSMKKIVLCAVLALASFGIANAQKVKTVEKEVKEQVKKDAKQFKSDAKKTGEEIGDAAKKAYNGTKNEVKKLEKM